MKTCFKNLANLLAAALQLFSIHWFLSTANAAVPVAWTNSPGMSPYPVKPVPHGSTVDFAVTLRGYTSPPIESGADVRLWFQTNGMGSAWWSAPATFDGSTITATFGPAQDCGADRVSLFFGAPSNVFASAVLRLTHAPGFTPASLPIPVPTLDFSCLEVLNAPWATPADVSTALLAATNYTDAALRDYASGNETDPVWSAEKSSYLPKSGGAVTGETSVAGLAITASPGWPEYRILFGPNSLDGTYIYWDDQSGRFATWRTAYGGYRFAMEDDLAAMAQSAINYVNAVTNALENAGASKLRNYLAEGDTALVFDGYARQDAGPPLLRLGLDGWSSWLFPSCASVTNIARTVVSATAADVISHTNSLFVAAVTNCPVVIATATSADFDLGDYGTYGTVAAALAALAAALATLKRGKADKGELRYAKKTLRNADMVVSLSASLYPILATNGLISLTLYADDVSLRVVRDGETGEVTGAAVHTVVDGEDTLLLTFDEQGEHLASGWSVTFAQSPVLNDFTFAYLLSDRTVILLDSLDNGEHEIDVGNGDKIVYVRPPAAVDGRIRDFILDVRATNTNMSAAHSLNLELDGVGVDYLISVPNGEDFDDISEIEVAKAVSASVPSVIWVRLYFTETAFATDALPVFAIRREDVTAPAGQ